MKKIFLLLFLLSSISISAQILKPVNWKFTSSKPNAKVGETIELTFTANIDEGWYMYSSDLKVEGPLPTTANFTANPSYKLIGKLTPIKPKQKYDEIWEGKVDYFEKNAKFVQKVKILKENPVIEGRIECQTCTTKDGKCVPNKDKFKFEIKAK